MTRLSHRFAVFGILFLLVAFALSQSPGPRPAVSNVAAQGDEVFQEGGVVIPANDCAQLPQAERWRCKLLAGVPSHRTTGGVAATADADPTGGTVGYCVAIQNEGHTGTTGAAGFSVTNATILSTSIFNNGSSTTTDDVYCAVIQPTPATTSARPSVDLAFAYSDGTTVTTIHLLIEAVTVRLIGTDGVVGGSAQVCTQGWDPTFLTGKASNDPPTAPNPLDVVTVDDWRVLSPVSVAKEGVLRKPNSPEWCVTLSSPVPATGIDVAFDFWATFNPATASDDYLASVTATDVVNIKAAEAAELRHVVGAADPDTAQLITAQAATTNVVGAPHTACVIPSVTGDKLNASDIEFVSSDGAKGHVLSVVHDGESGAPDLAGVVNGTLCFTWTSSTAGSQGVGLRFTASLANPLNTTSQPIVLSATWDTNGDGNPSGDEPTGGIGGMLIKRWATLDHTVITVGGDITKNIVTNTSVTLPVTFNVADGAFLGTQQLTEWVVGSRPGAPGQPAIIEPVEGATMTLTVTGGCGYFVTDPPGFSRTLVTTSRDGRVPFAISVDNDTGCIPGNAVHVTIVASYPPGVQGAPIAPETVDIIVQFTANSTRPPLLRWVGQTASITYAFAGNCQGAVAVFTVADPQKGTFVSSVTPAQVSGSTARVPITTTQGCSASINYESEDQGEVDIIAQLDCLLCNPPLETAVYSKVVFPIFFLQFEDLTATVPEELTVSERGDLDVDVRGWFLGSNPSPRPAETTADGRRLPAGRWVLPEDWPTLKGPDGFRRLWPGIADMPPAKVTFYIVNEPVRNNFQAGVKTGSAGFFLLDEHLEIDINIDPVSGKPSALGSLQKPRVISEYSDLDGRANIDVFGDLNLSFEGCKVNVPTGNPHCEPGDIAGTARYFAVADYPELRGKHPPVTSNTVGTTFTWQGYKRITVEEVEGVASDKYVVAHLKDRDGFCDALSYNNVLGNPVSFQIDAGDGIIVDVQTPPVVIGDGKRSATGITFDTLDDEGKPMNAQLARITFEDDECQAWIRVSNTLLTPLNVLVRFPAQPVAVPGDLRITALTCGPGGEATITNRGTGPTSLNGFALRSFNPSNLLNPEEHYGLSGVLQPGQSITVNGGAGDGSGWIFAGLFAFGNVGNDYARLAWNETTVSLRTCAGVQSDTPSPAQDADGEGQILLDTVVTFEAEDLFELSPGWNLVTGPGSATTFADAFGEDADAVDSVYTWDTAAGAWKRYVRDDAVPGPSLDGFEPGQVYWIEVNRPFTLHLRK